MEKALLIHLSTNKQEKQAAAESMQELRGLVKSAGAEILEEVYQFRPQKNPKYFIGEGKADEISLLIEDLEADLVVFDHVLTPIQQRGLEDKFQSKVVDRTQIILDIFAQRAHSREGKLQVELAQLNYLLPRLTGKGKALSRLGGGIGTRGPGEKKLEEDRRRIQERITHIKRALRKIQQRRAEQRKSRNKSPIPLASLVGYTNAGKSTLFNQLTQENRLASSQLFATLDPVIRRLNFTDGSMCYLSDTVGFIKKLPVELKTAFRATLEELLEADCICHVIDITSSQSLSQVEAVERILSELGAVDVPHIMIYNKIDLVPEKQPLLQKNQTLENPSVYLSAQTGEGITDLKAKLQYILFKDLKIFYLRIPKSNKIAIHSFPKWSIVLKRRETRNDYELKLMADPKSIVKYAPYILGGEETW